MDTILHIGAPKTGSTALQTGLYTAREQLLEKGVLYPFLTSADHSKNHGPLILSLVPRERLPRVFKFLSDDDLAATARSAVEEIQYQIAKTDPKCLLLSSEYFFRAMPPGAWPTLLAQIRGADPANVAISCYVRRPSSHYLSKLQQRLKASHEVLQPNTTSVRKVLESYRQEFPLARISVRPFVRTEMVGNDILADVLSHDLDGYGLGEAIEPASGEVNTTLSPEAMEVVRSYRLRFFPDDNDVFKPSSTKLIRKLLVLDQRLELGRPKLHDAISDAIDYCSADILWLRDEYGVEFQGIDYDRAGTQSLDSVTERPLALEEIVSIDPKNIRNILKRLRSSNWAKSDPANGSWIEGWLEEL